MKVKIEGCKCIVEREPVDPKFYNGGRAGGNAGESRLLYHVKGILNRRGCDLVKKRMCRDGHLVDEMKQYLCPPARPKKDKPHICISNPRWSIEGAEVDFNNDGRVELEVVYDVLGRQPDCMKMVARIESDAAGGDK